MKKIAVCGKGGSGKSTISALLAKALVKRGYNVLVVDIDESNYGLHRQLGMELPDQLVNYFGGKDQATKAMTEYYKDHDSKKIFDKKWGLSDLPINYISEKGGVKLIAMGKIDHFGEGCACTIGTLAALFFDNLELGAKDVVIADTEAGIEHMGRGIERGFDTILMVVDPSYESLRLCKKMGDMIEGNAKAYYVLNKVDNGLIDDMLAGLDNADVAAVIPANQALFKATLQGRELDFNVKEIDELAEYLRCDVPADPIT